MTYIRKLLKKFGPLSSSITWAAFITVLVIFILFKSNVGVYKKRS